MRHDYGFAPNPFWGVCTLATCKPRIRKAARRGDWIVATGSAAYNLSGRLVCVMVVDEDLTFDQYWNDKRFRAKRPNLRGSLMQAFGDNIYHRAGRKWLQEDSHHSRLGGRPNRLNVEHDTQVDRMLVAHKFFYLGKDAVTIPTEFRKRVPGHNLCAVRGERNQFGEHFRRNVMEWIEGLSLWGQVSEPAEWKRLAK